MRRTLRMLSVVVLLTELLVMLPLGVAADDALVSTCDDASFAAALATVQTSGGGTITFSCSGTIPFTSEKTITSNVTIIGGGVITFDGGGTTHLFSVNSGATLELDGVILQNGSAAGWGGAIYNDGGTLTVTASTFSGNSGSLSGAIFSNGTVTVTSSTFSGNSATSSLSSLGGAIYNDRGTLTVTASTFSGNSADLGGAIANYRGVLTVTSSTFSGNSTDFGGAIYNSFTSGNSADKGGAIYNSLNFDWELMPSDTWTVTASTFSGNSATSGFGAAIYNDWTLTVGASILTDSPSGVNCSGAPLTSQGSNLSDETTCGLGQPGDQQNTDPLLGPLADNGGPTQTHLPQAGSPAIDAALSCTTDTDQRGITRPQGPACDIGSVEVIPPLSVATPTVNPSPSTEGQSVTASATFSGGVPPFSCTVDYGDGSGAQPGIATGGTCTGPAHFYVDDNPSGMPSDDYTVTVSVTDALGTVSRTVLHTVNNVAPTVIAPVVDSEPSNEGQSVVASATFTDPGTGDLHTCTVDYGDGSGPVAGTITPGAGGGTCTGPAHIYVDDDPSGTSSDDYTVTVTVTDDDTGVGSNSLMHTVANVAPMINDITTNEPVPRGQPVTITVDASDAGVNDTLTYRFDCDNNGSYETPGVDNQGDCALDPSAATSTIGVQVEDDDLGVVTGTVEVSQAVLLCGDYGTGTISTPTAGGGCPAGTVQLMVPSASPTTFCINLYTGAFVWSPGGSCGTGYLVHLIPDDGPLAYCQNLWTGHLRVSWTGQCGTYELAGVIPG